LAIAFGERIRYLRQARALTQEQLAERAGVHPTFISNIERGWSQPTLRTILSLAHALDSRPGELVDELPLVE
jgi:transcriptional regulator with XRE-family HTH domain